MTPIKFNGNALPRCSTMECNNDAKFVVHGVKNHSTQVLYSCEDCFCSSFIDFLDFTFGVYEFVNYSELIIKRDCEPPVTNDQN